MMNWKKTLSLALAGVMALQVNGLAVLAETVPEAGAKAAFEVLDTEIGSDVWETPVIPDAAKYIAGVGQTEISLNETTGDGTWEYLYDIPDYTQPGGIPAPTEENQDFDFGAWEERDWQNIKVPGEPLMQGFDILTNNEYYYQREITVPEDFAGNRVLIRFDGVYSNARVWVDGKHIRTHVGGFTTWDCDITEYAAPGETVTMTVGAAELYSTTKGIWNPEGKSVNNPANATEYAHHNMGGILRDVSLVAMPFDSIARTHVNTDFDETFTDANLEVTAQVDLLKEDATLLVELLDGESLVTSGEIEFEREAAGLENLPELAEEASALLEEQKDNLYEGNTGEVGQYAKEAYENMRSERDNALKVLARARELSAAKKLVLPVSKPKQWDAEHPNLYTLRTTLFVDDEKVQVNEERVGFREIHYGGREETDANKVYVNGREVKLRGTCRHDVSDDLGRSMTREESYAEIEAYKKANINHIRTSHYPASEDLLDACDEMGIYVEQESAVCFQGPWADVSSKYEDFLPQFTEMIERDRNRPSILIWSLGNESNYNKVASQSGGNAFQDERDYLRDVDTTRPCVFSFPDTGEPAGFVDIYSAHYASVTGGMGRSDKPVIHDEYAHIACYNLDELQRDVNVRNFWGESVKKGWENIFTSDGALGGALWGGIDDVFYIPEGTTERWQSHSDGQTAGYGEWGSVLDAYLREKPEAYLTKKAYSPVRVDEDACYVSENTMYIPVKNWFDHTNMNELKLEYTIGGEKKTITPAESIAPHGEGVITINGVSQNADSVNLKFYTPDGIMADECNVKLAATQYSFTPASDQAPRIEEKEQEILVKGEAFEVVFDKGTGLISKAQFQGEDLVTGGPYLHVTGMGLGTWTPAAEDGLAVKTEGQYAVATLKGTYGNGQGVRFDVKISGNGIITTDYTLTTAPATASGLREVGISYDISKEAESVSWLRNGLYTAYPEDHIGRNEGTALKVREGSDKTPDQYGVEPQWPWKDDMKNYFVYSTDDPNNGLVTNDFKTMREHVWYYDVNYGTGEDSPRISVESQDAGVAARVAITYDLGYVDDRDASIKYTGGWGTYDANADYAGTETFSTALGATCEFTFTGTGVRYIGAKQKNTGLVKVYVDGEFKEEIDTYSNLGSDLKQAVIYSIEGLPEGEHTIKLETSGGHADCIVVDAFEVLSAEGSNATEEAKLVINNQWYYPNLAWGNYTGNQGRLANGTTGSATIRLTNQKNFTAKVVPSLVNVSISETNDNRLKASYDLRNAGEGAEIKLQWYRVSAGDPDSKAQAIEGAQSAELSMAGLEANKVFCQISLVIDGKVNSTVKSNAIEIGQDSYRYYDILDDSPLFAFEGTKGADYKTDSGMSWTANAYGKSVTYLLDTQNKASVTFAFTGSGIRWVGAKENNQGIAEVSIDGSEPIEIDLFDAGSTTGNQVNEVLFEQVWEEPGDHTITVTRTGRKHADSLAANVSLDAFIVIRDQSEHVRISDAAVAEQEDGSLAAECKIENGTEEDLEYQWYAAEAYSSNGYAKEAYEAIEGAVEKNYMPTKADAGKLLCCEIDTADGAPIRSGNTVLVNALMIDDTEDAVQYPEGSITDTADKSYLQGNKPYNNTITYFAGGNVTLSFNGTGIVWIAGYDQTLRRAAVQIDGGEARNVEIKGAGSGKWDFNQYEVFRISGLEPGNHQITIEPGSGADHNNIDAFMVLNPGSVQPEAKGISEEKLPAMEMDNLRLEGEAFVEAGAVPAEKDDAAWVVTVQKATRAGKAEIAEAVKKLSKAIQDFKASRIEEKPVFADKTALRNLYQACAALKFEEYTEESWKAFAEAMSQAAAVLNKTDATKEMADQAIHALSKARSSLVKAPVVNPPVVNPPKAPELPKKGSCSKQKGLRFRVTASSAKTKTVMVANPLKKTGKKVTVPDTIKINGYTYKVTKIADKAFRNNKKLSKVTLGKNLTGIGKESFAGCKALKTVTIKSKLIGKIERNAFKDISVKAKIYVPGKKFTTYKKKLKKAKLNAKVSIRKKAM